MSRPIGMIHDPDAERRSVMLSRKVLCNGQRTGIRCEHYWTQIRNEPSANPDLLVIGGKLRFCRAWGAEPLEFGEGHTELATSGVDEPLHRGCTMYKPAGVHGDDYEEALSGLVQIARVPKWSGEKGWETEESFVYAPSVAPRNRYDVLYEDSTIAIDANDKALKDAFERVPVRPDLLDGAVGREHEDAFGMSPGKHDGPGFVPKISIDDVLKDIPAMPEPVKAKRLPRTSKKTVSKKSPARKKGR